MGAFRKEIKDRLKTVSQADLLRWKESVADECAEIRHQIDSAKRRTKIEKARIDLEWLEKAEYALKNKQRLHQHILAEQSIRKLSNRTYKERVMLDLLKDTVGDERFFEVERRAKDIVEEE